MATLLILIIYLAFISLGLPDSALGSTWPVMRTDFGAGLDIAGYISMTVSAGTILSSLASDRLLHKFGTAKITAVSVLLTAAGLLMYAVTPSVWFLFLAAIPLGIGAGSVDAGLNAYVAAHYKAYHMSWLHCFWGIGATAGPIILSFFMNSNNNWRGGFLSIAVIQFIMAGIIFAALPMWQKQEKKEQELKSDQSEAAEEGPDPGKPMKLTKLLQIKGLKITLLSFLFYCGLELTVGLWGSSFLVGVKGITPVLAARWVSMYYAGITVGRLINGFIAIKVKSSVLIRSGQLIILAGALLLLMPLPSLMSMIGFVLIGLGCAPIYPCTIHETPNRFGKKYTQKIIGLQMACAYTGSTFLPPLLGLIASRTDIHILPYFLMVYIAGMLFCSERMNLIMKKQKSK